MVRINIKSLYVVIEVCRVVLAPQNSAGKENPGFSNQKQESMNWQFWSVPFQM